MVIKTNQPPLPKGTSISHGSNWAIQTPATCQKRVQVAVDYSEQVNQLADFSGKQKTPSSTS